LFVYRLRGIHPFWYGCVEIAVGLIVLIFTFVPTTHYLASDSQTFFERGVTKLIGVMAGVYIIIRGLDNAAIASTCFYVAEFQFRHNNRVNADIFGAGN
jgi:hypothetical protein